MLGRRSLRFLDDLRGDGEGAPDARRSDLQLGELL